MFENRRRAVLMGSVPILLAATVAAYWYWRSDAQLEKVRELGEQLRSEETRKLARE